jgi:hypothetical protein
MLVAARTVGLEGQKRGAEDVATSAHAGDSVLKEA